MACTGAPFVKRTKSRLSLFHIWRACIQCGCDKCRARMKLEAEQLNERPETLGNILVKDGFRPPRVRWRGGIKAAVEKRVIRDKREHEIDMKNAIKAFNEVVRRHSRDQSSLG